MPEKLTHEKFIEKCKNRTGYTILGTYSNSQTPVSIRHDVCGRVFEMRPAKFLAGQGCKICNKKEATKKLSNIGERKFHEALDQLGFEVVEKDFEYKNTSVPVLVKCKVCGAVSRKTPSNLIAGHGCGHCQGKRNNLPEPIEPKLRKKAPEWELVGEYTNIRTRTLFKHKPCGHTYMKTPSVVLAHPKSCQFCNAKKLSSPEKFFAKIKDKKDYEVLGEYVNSKTKVLVKHKVCGREFLTVPDAFMRAEEGCPFCKGDVISKATRWTHERFLQELGERAEEFMFLTRYTNAFTPIKVQHQCGNEFEILPNNLLRGSGCKICKYSTGEGQVCRYIKRLLPGVEVIQSDRTHLPNHAEIDIYVPSLNLAIEYDGLAYHTEEHYLAGKRRKWTKAQAQNRQKWKTDECYKQGIRMIHIFEDEWLEHRDIVEDKLRATLKRPAQRYYARKLDIRVVGKRVAAKFLEENHIQGKAKTVVSIGLYDDDKLLAVQSFCKYTRKKIPGAWELVRYATLLGTQVVGGFSKCLKWFERNYAPKEVISFADLRWCDRDNNVYLANGFSLTEEVSKKYWYVKPPKRFHKSDFRKRKFRAKYPEVYSPNKTEAQMAKEIGLQRIYDCGLIRYSKEY